MKTSVGLLLGLGLLLASVTLLPRTLGWVVARASTPEQTYNRAPEAKRRTDYKFYMVGDPARPTSDRRVPTSDFFAAEPGVTYSLYLVVYDPEGPVCSGLEQFVLSGWALGDPGFELLDVVPLPQGQTELHRFPPGYRVVFDPPLASGVGEPVAICRLDFRITEDFEYGGLYARNGWGPDYVGIFPPAPEFSSRIEGCLASTDPGNTGVIVRNAHKDVPEVPRWDGEEQSWLGVEGLDPTMSQWEVGLFCGRVFSLEESVEGAAFNLGRWMSEARFGVFEWYTPGEEYWLEVRNAAELYVPFYWTPPRSGRPARTADKWEARGDLLRPGDNVLVLARRFREAFARAHLVYEPKFEVLRVWHLTAGCGELDQPLLRQSGIVYGESLGLTEFQARKDLGTVELVLEEAGFTLRELLWDLEHFEE